MSILSRRNVDSITARLGSMVAELASYADAQDGLAAQDQQAIDRLAEQKLQRQKERDRARVVAGRLSAILK